MEHLQNNIANSLFRAQKSEVKIPVGLRFLLPASDSSGFLDLCLWPPTPVLALRMILVAEFKTHVHTAR